MIDTSHPGTTPDDAETASDLHSATGQPGTIGDWAASLTKLLRVAFRAVDTDRECAKAAIARASSLLRVQIERSSFDSAHNRVRLEQDIDVRRQVEEALRASEERWRTVFDNASVGIALTILRGRFVTAQTELQRHSLTDITDHASAKATTAPLAIAGDGEGLHSLMCGSGDEVVTFANPYLWR
jgi:hypothetical protein